VLGLPSLQTVVTLVVGAIPGSIQRVADQLSALYAPVLGPATATRWLESAHSQAVLLVTGSGLPDLLPGTVVAGPAARGLGASSELDAMFDDPRRATLDGPFVAVRLTPHGADLVTAAGGLRPLHRLQGDTATVWSTKALAAHVAAAARPRLCVDAVPDVILLDYVLGDGDLLEATTVPADALHVRATGARVVETQWASVGDRLAPGPPTDACALRSVLGDEMARVVKIPGATLGLTAGRDSNLALSCLGGRSRAIPTFTLGWPGDGDAEGASAAARAAQCSHHLVTSHVHDSAEGAWLDASRWTEGQVSGRNLLIAGLDWDARGVTWVTGSGGEIGRAFYGQHFASGGRARDRWRSFFVDPHRRAVPGLVLDRFEARVAREMSDAWSIRPDPVGAADVFYYGNRMGKWFDRTAHIDQISGRYPVYLAGPVARALLDIPEADRLSGRTFDRALSASGIDLHAVATDAILARYGLAAGASRSRRRLRSYLPRPVTTVLRKGLDHRRARHEPIHPEWALLDPLCRSIEAQGSIVLDVMGSRWWTHQLGSAPRWSGGEARRVLWNAVAVDAFDRQLPSLPVP
jgi:hypothetical protein